MFTKNCLHCGDTMTRKKKSEAMRPNWLFCSRRCQTVTNNKKRKNPAEESNCLRCKASFIKRTKKQSYCSDVCAVLFRNKHNNPSKSIKARIKIAESAKKRGTEHMHTPQAREKQRLSILGDKHWNWQGGITTLNKRLRNTKRHKAWVRSILERDNFTCQECLTRGGYLEVDHIKPFAFFPELRYEESNARTLCLECHRKTDTYMGRAYKHRLLASR